MQRHASKNVEAMTGHYKILQVPIIILGSDNSSYYKIQTTYSVYECFFQDIKSIIILSSGNTSYYNIEAYYLLQDFTIDIAS